MTTQYLQPVAKQSEAPDVLAVDKAFSKGLDAFSRADQRAWQTYLHDEYDEPSHDERQEMEWEGWLKNTLPCLD